MPDLYFDHRYYNHLKLTLNGLQKMNELGRYTIGCYVFHHLMMSWWCQPRKDKVAIHIYIVYLYIVLNMIQVCRSWHWTLSLGYFKSLVFLRTSTELPWHSAKVLNLYFFCGLHSVKYILWNGKSCSECFQIIPIYLQLYCCWQHIHHWSMQSHDPKCYLFSLFIWLHAVWAPMTRRGAGTYQ